MSLGEGGSCYLAGSRQQVHLDIGVGQPIEIHGLEALSRRGGKGAVSSQPSFSRLDPWDVDSQGVEDLGGTGGGK